MTTINSHKEAFVRLLIFMSAFVLCAIVLGYAFSRGQNLTKMVSEGFGYVAGFGVLFGLATLAEIVNLIRLFAKKWFGSDSAPDGG